MIAPRIRLAISRIIPFAVIWLITSIVYTLLERGILGGLDYYPSTGNPYDFTSSLIITPLMALMAGLLVGTIEVFYLNRLFDNRSFLWKILVKVSIYSIMVVFLLFAISVLVNAQQMHVTPSDHAAWSLALLFISSHSFWGVAVYVTYGIAVSLFFVEVYGNLGAGVLNNFFRGKYHKPIVEDRIFMFLDMKSSTTIAEALGHVKYFEMLREYFADLTVSIINYGGAIYQYVGDEIVVTWNVVDGVKNNNCIECFFDMKRQIKKLNSKYLQKFGLVPDFKAGFHSGKVTTGEIGVIKKDIIFTGDVLNTTARIQSLCNFYKVDFLISEQLLSLLKIDPSTEIKAIGETELKGREEKVRLFTFQLIEEDQ